MRRQRVIAMIADPAVPAVRPGAERQPGRAPDRIRPDPRPVVCVDLDSTLCDTRHRQPMLAGITDPSTVDWVAYAMACPADAPVPGCCRLVRMLAAAGYRIVILSARDRAARVLTEQWLARFAVPYDDLILGSRAEYGAGLAGYKSRRVRHLMAAGTAVRLMIDDDPAVGPAMAQLGVPTLTVRPPGEVPAAASTPASPVATPMASPVATPVASVAAGTPGTSGV
jgi:hypothetical protein